MVMVKNYNHENKFRECFKHLTVTRSPILHQSVTRITPACVTSDCVGTDLRTNRSS